MREAIFFTRLVPRCRGFLLAWANGEFPYPVIADLLLKRLPPFRPIQKVVVFADMAARHLQGGRRGQVDRPGSLLVLEG
jgi:hypothetical protein